LGTDDGINLLEPGHNPQENEQFLVFLSAVLTAVDRHADKLRAGAANTGNDLRLGANEAPPAIISVFLGEELTKILEGLSKGKKVESRGQTFLNIGVDTLPALPLDNTDRNRTSPFAFTGNKFEFRMVPSSASISGANTVLNTVVAEALDEIATRLEKAKDINKEAAQVVKDAYLQHGRVIYNGNNYSEELIEEAKRRGLPNIRSTVEALKAMANKSAIKLFGKYKVLTGRELHSRYEIYLEQYIKNINIEAMTSIYMVKKQYLPVIIEWTGELAGILGALNSIQVSGEVQREILDKVSAYLTSANKKLCYLEAVTKEAQVLVEAEKKAKFYRDKVVPAMNDLRIDIDALEMLVPNSKWPVPSYAEMLFKL
jgi:glutamine synthetase